MPAVRDFIGSRGPARLLPSAALLSLAACGGDPVFTMLFTTEHFAYFAEEGATPPCDGTAQWLERYYKANAKFLGAALSGDEKIHYYLVKNRDTLPAFECPPTRGCAWGTTIASTPLPLRTSAKT